MEGLEALPGRGEREHFSLILTLFVSARSQVRKAVQQQQQQQQGSDRTTKKFANFPPELKKVGR
jgi:hypothetical protein